MQLGKEADWQLAQTTLWGPTDTGVQGFWLRGQVSARDVCLRFCRLPKEGIGVFAVFVEASTARTGFWGMTEQKRSTGVGFRVGLG